MTARGWPAWSAVWPFRADFQVKISYAGQQQVCELCAAPGHIARVCPLRGKCFQCGLEGHLSRNCPQRAGYRARDDVEKDVPDPTAAEAAARASGAPQVESDVDLRGNQLNEFSSCWYPPPPPWVRNSLPIMYLWIVLMWITPLMELVMEIIKLHT